MASAPVAKFYVMLGVEAVYMCVVWCRYQYDPNPRVRDAMSAIWRALVPEPRTAIQVGAPSPSEIISELFEPNVASTLIRFTFEYSCK